MKHLFNPKSIAFIGASTKPKTVGSGLASNLLKSKKKVFFINPKYKKIFGKKSYSSIGNIKEGIDLAIIAIPAAAVKGVVEECIAKRVKGLIIISAGFSEIGNASLEKDVVGLCRKAGVFLVGPNCLGVLNPRIGLNASFAPFDASPGNIALISQSGALIDAIIDLSRGKRYGFSKIISIGNEADLDMADYLEYLEKDKETKVISIYMEGMKNGRRFIEAVKNIKKPIVVLKSGKSDSGKMAAMTHTGSIAGDKDIYSAIFKQFGIIETQSVEEFLDTSKALSFTKRTKRGAGIITNGGGFGILMVDCLEENNIKLSKIKKETIQKMAHFKNAAIDKNPVDILGDALAEKYEIATEALIEQNDINTLIVIMGMQIMTEPEKTAKILVKIAKKKKDKTIICCLMGGSSFSKTIEILEKNGLPCFNDPKRTALVLKNLTL